MSVRARVAVLVAAIAVLLAGVASERAAAAPPCWERVIADWSDNGRVDHAYPLACYREAVKHLPEDLRAYSSAPAEIDRALAERRVALPASVRAAAGRPTASTQRAGRVGVRLAMLLPPAAGILVAAGVGLWLVRARRRPAGRR